jgi:hypothetical protein
MLRRNSALSHRPADPPAGTVLVSAQEQLNQGLLGLLSKEDRTAKLICRNPLPQSRSVMAAPPVSPPPISPAFETTYNEPRPRWPWVLVGVVIVVVIIVVAAVLASVSKGTSTTVTYTQRGFEWDSPPSTMCNTFSISTPGVPFTVNASETFNVSWYVTCTTGGPSTIHSASAIGDLQGSSSGTLVSSNLPVTVYSAKYTYFNITWTAPDSSYTGSLLVMIVASSP